MTARRRSADPPSGRTIFSLSERETFEIGRLLGSRLNGGELVLLVGQLGSGKTVFARGIASGLGIPARDVSSPSYTLVQEYQGGRVPLFHIDLYRLEDPSEIATLGLEDLLGSGAVVVVEWGERVPAAWAQDPLTVRFHDIGESSRRIDLLADSPAAAALAHDA
jgi:tRNA threonylcarbamoyladenosine biosynthesis protein TsaE